MPEFNRRNLLLSSTALVCGSILPLDAIAPIERSHARIKGLSLAAYSMRSEMQWFKGKEGTGKMTMLDFLEFTARTQFDAAELTAYFFPEPLTANYLNQVKRRAHLLGLDLSGGAIGNNFSMTPGSEEAKLQSEYVKLWIDRYADLGIPVIRVFAGSRGPKGATEAQMLDHARVNLEEALIHAEKRGVILGIENHDSMTEIDKLIAFIQPLQSDYLGVTWDSANITTSGDPYAELTKLAPYCVNAQVKVKIPLQGKKVDSDFEKLIAILKQAHYAGYVVLEYEEKEDPFTEIPKYQKLLKDLI